MSIFIEIIKFCTTFEIFKKVDLLTVREQRSIFLFSNSNLFFCLHLTFKNIKILGMYHVRGKRNKKQMQFGGFVNCNKILVFKNKNFKLLKSKAQ